MSCLLSFSGCKTRQIDNSSSSSSSKSKNVPTSISVPNIKSEEAKKVVANYFNALNEPTLENAKKFCTDRSKGEDTINKAKEVKLINISEDVGGKWRSEYMHGPATILVPYPYDAISFGVTYNIQYKDEFKQQVTETSGIKEKIITLVKETETAQWKVAEIGY